MTVVTLRPAVRHDHTTGVPLAPISRLRRTVAVLRPPGTTSAVRKTPSRPFWAPTPS